MGGLGITYNVQLGLTGKRVVDFLLVLIELFSLSVTAEAYHFKISDFAPAGAGCPEFQVEGVAPTNHSSSQKTRLNDLSGGVKIWTDSFFCHNPFV